MQRRLDQARRALWRVGGCAQRGQVTARYQQYNETTERFDKYDGDANYVGSKHSPGPFKGVEQRDAKKPSRE